MRCRSARVLMNAARDGELAGRERRALERHLDQCEACRTERVTLEGVLAALDGLPREAAVPTRLEDQVFRQIRGLADEQAGSPGSLSTWLRGLVPAIAATTVVVVAMVGMRSREGVGPASVAAGAKAVAASAERTVVARRAKVRAPSEP